MVVAHPNNSITPNRSIQQNRTLSENTIVIKLTISENDMVVDIRAIMNTYPI